MQDDDDGATIIDDGLSICDEESGGGQQRERLTVAQYNARRKAAKQYKCFTLSLLFVTFLISAIVTTVRYYRHPRQSKSGGQLDIFGSGNGNSNAENERRFNQTLEYLTKYAISKPETLTDNIGYGVLGINYAPQYTAALWMAKYDMLRLPIPTTTEGGERPEWKVEYPFLQRYSLAVLYFATGGDWHWLWTVNFMKGSHECWWFDIFDIQGYSDKFLFGVLCDMEPDYENGEDEVDVWDGKRTVTGISLPPQNNMWGTLPPEVYHLKYLKVFHIQHNAGLMGTIPFQYGELKNLNTLALINNGLNGEIPRNFANLKKMEILRLEENNFSGDSTKGDLDFLGEMTSLKKLTLDYNPKLTGTFPEAITKLSNLIQVTLSNTKMYGNLPYSLSNLEKLKGLFLDDCDFEGNVEMLSLMTSLTHLYLEDNMFTGVLHDSLFSDLKNLTHLDISNCSFSGSVPGHFFEFPELEVLDMSSNNLVGELPAEVLSGVAKSKLQFLSLHTNNITGPIPTGIGNLRNLTTLDLSSNQFSDEIPSQIGQLDKLDILFLGRNNYSKGAIPEWIYNMTKLTELSLKGSSLTGSIPKWLGDMTGLKLLDLGENELIDTIPQALGQLSELMVLILNSNKLIGQLGLGELKKLETLLIDDNSLTGTTEPMCKHVLQHFTADCARLSDTGTNGAVDAEIECDCCTLCCADENITCNDSEWLGNHNGIWEVGYQRLTWDFEDGFISPLLDYNKLQG